MVDVAAGQTLDFNNELNLHGNILNKNGTGTMNVNNRLSTGGRTIKVLSGTIGGNGTISGNVDDHGGTMSPGNSPGTLEISDDFMQGDRAILLVETGGSVASLDHDQLVVKGTAGLAGTLQVALLDNLLPTSGITFTILEFGAIRGSVDVVNLPALSAGLSWDTSTLYSRGTLAVVPETTSWLMVQLALVIVIACSHP